MSDTMLQLITLNQSSSQLSSEEYMQILQKFTEKFTLQSIINIIFYGLLSIRNPNKIEWISFMTKIINEVLPEQNTYDTEKSITGLDADTLTYICQFLKVDELLILQTCSTFFFKHIRSTPHCLTSLNYPFWASLLPHSYHSNAKLLTRLLSSVKQLYMQSTACSDIMRKCDTFNNITHLTLDGDFHQWQQFGWSSLASLTMIRYPMNSIYEILETYQHNNISLKEVKLYETYYPLSANVTKFLLNSQINKLSLSVQNSTTYFYRAESVKPLTKFPKQASLWNTLKHFSFDAECFTDDAIRHFIHLTKDSGYRLCYHVLTNCKHLESLELTNIDDVGYYTMFGNSKPIKSNHLEKLILHISSPNVCKVLQYLYQQTTFNLNTMDLLLWDKGSEKSIRNKGSEILNHLKSLLLSQLKKTHLLRDIIFTGITNTRYERRSDHEIITPNRVKLLYLMLIHVFENDKIKFRKELNLTFNIKMAKDNESWELETINKLLNILNKKVECCTITFNFHNVLDLGFYFFIDDLKDNNEWTVSVENGINYNQSVVENYSLYDPYESLENCKIWKIVNFPTENLKIHRNISYNAWEHSQEEHRLMYEKYDCELNELNDSIIADVVCVQYDVPFVVSEYSINIQTDENIKEENDVYEDNNFFIPPIPKNRNANNDNFIRNEIETLVKDINDANLDDNPTIQSLLNTLKQRLND